MISNNRYVTFWYKCVAFCISGFEVCDVILKRPDIITILHKTVRINHVLPVILELTDIVTACRLYIVD